MQENKNSLSYTFRSDERLKSKKDMQELFERGSSFYIYPLKIRYLHFPLSTPGVMTKVVFMVSHKNFKRAVDRNLIKRRMREAYRLNKYRWQAHGQASWIAFIYVAKEKLPFQTIQQHLVEIMDVCYKKA